MKLNISSADLPWNSVLVWDYIVLALVQSLIELWQRRGKEKHRERRLDLLTPPSAPVYEIISALCNLDKLCSAERHIWKHKQCRAYEHKHWVTSACSRTHAECVWSGAQEGGRTWKLNKQRSVTVVEGEPASNERIERIREGWERDEGLFFELYNMRFVVEEHITWVGKGREAADWRLFLEGWGQDWGVLGGWRRREMVEDRNAQLCSRQRRRGMRWGTMDLLSPLFTLPFLHNCKHLDFLLLFLILVYFYIRSSPVSLPLALFSCCL